MGGVQSSRSRSHARKHGKTDPIRFRIGERVGGEGEMEEVREVYIGGRSNRGPVRTGEYGTLEMGDMAVSHG